VIALSASTRSPRRIDPRRRAFRSAGGFTLLETIIALTLTATIFVVLAQALVKGIGTYNQQEIRAELYQMGRVALDRMTRDIRAGGTPAVDAESVTFPFDSNGDGAFDSVRRYEKDGDRLTRQTNAEPPEVLAEKVDSILFAGEDFTTIDIVLVDGGERVELRTGVRHEN
jgi:Tfp pilus assembly protein PilW